MPYQRHAPAAALRDVVEHYWTVTAPAPPRPIRAVLVPAGRATLQCCLGCPGVRIDPDGNRARNADVLLPVTATPLVLEQTGRSHYVGVQFTPWGARRLWPWLGAAPVPSADLADLPPDPAVLATDPAGALDRWLAALLPGTTPAPDVVRTSVHAVDAAPAEVGVADLARRACCSPSTLYRAFVRHVGVGPKRYIAILRHRRFTDALLAASGGDQTAMLVAACGYCDQSHMNREFRRLTGMAPGTFRHTYDGIARLMALPR